MEDKDRQIFGAVLSMLSGIILVGLIYLIINPWGKITETIAYYPSLIQGMLGMMIFAAIGVYISFMGVLILIIDFFCQSEEDIKLRKKIKEINKKYKTLPARKLYRQLARREFRVEETRRELMEFKK